MSCTSRMDLGSVIIRDFPFLGELFISVLNIVHQGSSSSKIIGTLISNNIMLFNILKTSTIKKLETL